LYRPDLERISMRFLAVLFSVMFLSGCATPDVVEIRQMNDESLSCTQLIQASEEAKRFGREAKGERKATGTNVAAAIFWWPGLLATYVNTEDALDAARERQEVLKRIYDDKGCTDAVTAKRGGTAASLKLEQLKEMSEQGLITEDEYTAARKKALGIDL